MPCRCGFRHHFRDASRPHWEGQRRRPSHRGRLRYHEKYFLDTEQKCNSAGFSCVPLVFEAHGGGWGIQPRKSFGFIGQQLQAAGDWCREGIPLRFAQRVSCSLHREAVRAILRRLAPPGDTDGALAYEESADEEA